MLNFVLVDAHAQPLLENDQEKLHSDPNFKSDLIVHML